MVQLTVGNIGILVLQRICVVDEFNEFDDEVIAIKSKDVFSWKKVDWPLY